LNTPTERGGRDEKTNTKIVKNGGPEGGMWAPRARDGGESGHHTPMLRRRVRACEVVFGGGCFGVGLGILRRLRWYIGSYDRFAESMKTDTDRLMYFNREKVSKEK
jgi:hypothetical protein